MTKCELKTKICEAASDYILAKRNSGFADYCGGLDKTEENLTILVVLWQSNACPEGGCKT